MRNIKASCECGSSEFVAHRKPPEAASDAVACATCGRAFTYGELLDRIGEEATRQAQAALAQLKKKRRKRN